MLIAVNIIIIGNRDQKKEGRCLSVFGMLFILIIPDLME
jgi:hypothetical protein